MIKVMMVFESIEEMRRQLGVSAPVAPEPPQDEEKPKKTTRKRKTTPKASTVDATEVSGEAETTKPAVDDLPEDHLLKELRVALTKASDRTTAEDVWAMMKPFDGAKVAKDIPPSKRQEVIDLAEKLGA